MSFVYLGLVHSPGPTGITCFALSIANSTFNNLSFVGLLTNCFCIFLIFYYMIIIFALMVQPLNSGMAYLLLYVRVKLLILLNLG